MTEVDEEDSETLMTESELGAAAYLKQQKDDAAEEKVRAKVAAKQAKIMTGIIKEDYSIAMDDFSSLIVDRNKLKYTRDVLKAVPKYI